MFLLFFKDISCRCVFNQWPNNTEPLWTSEKDTRKETENEFSNENETETGLA